MAMSNRDRVGRAFEALARGLRPFLDDRLPPRMTGGKPWPEALDARDGQRYEPDDPAAQLRAIEQFWTPFRELLGRSGRSWVVELRDTRNAWAHNRPFDHGDAYRALDTVERLLDAANAGELAAEVRRSKEELVRRRYEEQARQAARSGTAPTEAGVRGLVPWRDIATPHQDVREGRFSQAEFAADLHQVHSGDPNTAAEYADPVEFFRRTFLTLGLENLLVQAVQRITAAEGGAPVIDLQTNFGGGKTHSLLALYHLFCGRALTEFPQEVQDTVAAAGTTRLPKVQRAVVVGTMLKAGQVGHTDDGTGINTMWGELAWQLGGPDGYALVAESDRARTNPGDALLTLLRAYAPCVLLIDEWVAYARQLVDRDDLAGGTFETHFSFAQALTEAVRAVPGALLVVSLPASERGDEDVSAAEVGGAAGVEALRRLRRVVHRIDSSWRPATVEESFEIVRRRLFDPLSAERLARRDAVARAFVDFYRGAAGEFPAECATPDYERRIIRAYPVHPELFDRLYDDWSTLERFQRTRGVLRLMAKVVHALWEADDRSPLILPASVPLDNSQVADELTRYLDEDWKPILDVDVDGPHATPVVIDRERSALGQRRAARRVARTVFLGSAPTDGSANRGVEEVRIRLGSVLPGEPPAVFGDALRLLAERATYLYAEGSRYWYSVRATVSRKARDLTERYLRDTDRLHDEIVARLKPEERRRGDFARVHVVLPGVEVPDEDECRLVVLPPDRPHTPRDARSAALESAADILARHGSGLRLYRNMLVFLAAEARQEEGLRRAVAEHLAWDEIDRKKEELNLDGQQRGQAEARRRTTDEVVSQRLRDSYQWVLHPRQDGDDPTGDLRWEELRCTDGGGLAERASRKLAAEDQLRLVSNPVSLRVDLDGQLARAWRDGYVRAGDLWDVYARYCYLTRMRDRQVLFDALGRGPLVAGWERDGFALAESYDEAAGRYRGLVGGGEASAVASSPSTVVTATTLVVHPEAARRQLDAEEAERRRREEEARDQGEGAGPLGPGPGPGPGPTPRPSPGRPRRFHGAVDLDPERLAKQFGKVHEEVLVHLRGYQGARLTVTVDVSASAEEGFDEDVIRTVTENARTLRFDQAAFEEE